MICDNYLQGWSDHSSFVVIGPQGQCSPQATLSSYPYIVASMKIVQQKQRYCRNILVRVSNRQK